MKTAMELNLREMQKAAGGGLEEWTRALQQLKEKYNETNLFLLYLKVTEEEKAWLRSFQ